MSEITIFSGFMSINQTELFSGFSFLECLNYTTTNWDFHNKYINDFKKMISILWNCCLQNKFEFKKFAELIGDKFSYIQSLKHILKTLNIKMNIEQTSLYQVKKEFCNACFSYSHNKSYCPVIPAWMLSTTIQKNMVKKTMTVLSILVKKFVITRVTAINTMYFIMGYTCLDGMPLIMLFDSILFSTNIEPFQLSENFSSPIILEEMDYMRIKKSCCLICEPITESRFGIIKHTQVECSSGVALWLKFLLTSPDIPVNYIIEHVCRLSNTELNYMRKLAFNKYGLNDISIFKIMFGDALTQTDLVDIPCYRTGPCKCERKSHSNDSKCQVYKRWTVICFKHLIYNSQTIPFINTLIICLIIMKDKNRGNSNDSNKRLHVINNNILLFTFYQLEYSFPEIVYLCTLQERYDYLTKLFIGYKKKEVNRQYIRF